MLLTLCRSVFNNAASRAPAWVPVPDIQAPNADVSLHFMASNSVRYRSPVQDKFFSASGNYTENGDNGELYYLPDQYMNVMARIDQLQFCKSKDGSACISFLGLGQVLAAFEKLNPNAHQFATAGRIVLQAATTST